jgi:murein DD-endopeptidase MepM/ murein hydrolase activator NlpD
MFTLFALTKARRQILPVLLFVSCFAGAVPAHSADTKAPRAKPVGSLSVRWQPQRPVNGSPVLFLVTSSQPLKSLSGKWLEHEVFFSSNSGSKSWFGIAGASFETHPGKYPLELSGESASGKPVSFQKVVVVKKGKYISSQASVPKQFTEPSAEQLKKISEDKTLKERTFAHVSAERLWSGRFRAPASAPISGVFGTNRTFNGQVQSVHQGLDFAVPEGTPVTAVNTGTVLLAQPLFFEGGLVVLDHGQGLLTLYMHLSKIEVKEGDHITGGQKLGLSGGTGRATGPHLHVAVRWQGVYLDPATLLSLPLP